MKWAANDMKWAANDMRWAANVMKCHEMGCKWHEMNEIHAHMHTYDATTMRRRPEMREWRKCGKHIQYHGNMYKDNASTSKNVHAKHVQTCDATTVRQRSDDECNGRPQVESRPTPFPSQMRLRRPCDDNATTMRRGCVIRGRNA